MTKASMTPLQINEYLSREYYQRYCEEPTKERYDNIWIAAYCFITNHFYPSNAGLVIEEAGEAENEAEGAEEAENEAEGAEEEENEAEGGFGNDEVIKEIISEIIVRFADKFLVKTEALQRDAFNNFLLSLISPIRLDILKKSKQSVGIEKPSSRNIDDDDRYRFDDSRNYEEWVSLSLNEAVMDAIFSVIREVIAETDQADYLTPIQKKRKRRDLFYFLLSGVLGQKPETILEHVFAAFIENSVFFDSVETRLDLNHPQLRNIPDDILTFIEQYQKEEAFQFEDFRFLISKRIMADLQRFRSYYAAFVDRNYRLHSQDELRASFLEEISSLLYDPQTGRIKIDMATNMTNILKRIISPGFLITQTGLTTFLDNGLIYQKLPTTDACLTEYAQQAVRQKAIECIKTLNSQSTKIYGDSRLDAIGKKLANSGLRDDFEAVFQPVLERESKTAWRHLIESLKKVTVTTTPNGLIASLPKMDIVEEGRRIRAGLCRQESREKVTRICEWLLSDYQTRIHDAQGYQSRDHDKLQAIYESLSADDLEQRIKPVQAGLDQLPDQIKSLDETAEHQNLTSTLQDLAQRFYEQDLKAPLKTLLEQYLLNKTYDHSAVGVMAEDLGNLSTDITTALSIQDELTRQAFYRMLADGLYATCVPKHISPREADTLQAVLMGNAAVTALEIPEITDETLFRTLCSLKRHGYLKNLDKKLSVAKKQDFVVDFTDITLGRNDIGIAEYFLKINNQKKKTEVVRRKDDLTALMLVARHGNLSFAELLLKHGAQVMTKNRKEKTAIDIAREHNHQDLLNLLSARSADQPAII
jgi:hypothetical protein